MQVGTRRKRNNSINPAMQQLPCNQIKILNTQLQSSPGMHTVAHI